MQHMIKDYLIKYFELPAEFFREEANLYILSVLSLFFAETKENSSEIKTSDIDPDKLSMEINELENTVNGSNLKINLNQLLKVPKPEPVFFQDYIGRDGFCEYQLHMALCILEMPEKQENLLQHPNLLDNARTVGEFMQAFDILKYFSKN